MIRHNMIFFFRDGFFCKDGRGWYTSSSGRGRSVSWPPPTTIRGALRAAWGQAIHISKKADWPTKTEEVAVVYTLPLRRKLMDTNWEPKHRMWPVPHDAIYMQDDTTEQLQVLALKPQPPRCSSISVRGTEAMESLDRPTLQSKGKPSPRPAWWSDETFQQWLCGSTLSATHDQLRLHKQWRLQNRSEVHLKVNAETYAADDGMLYAKDIVETVQCLEQPDCALATPAKAWVEWTLACVCQTQTPAPNFPPRSLKIGGKNHIAQVETLAQPMSDTLWSCPKDLLEAVETQKPTGLRLMAISPAHFEQEGWLLDGFAETTHNTHKAQFVGQLPGVTGTVVLRSALVPRPEHVSGWDVVKNSPKATKRLVPAGSVYFVEKQDQSPFTPEEVRSLWLCQLGQDQQEGFGLFVAGIWHRS